MFSRSTIRLYVTSLAVFGLAIASCGYDAWLGMQCPTADMRCDELGSTGVGGNTGLAGHATGSFAAMAAGTTEPAPAPGLDSDDAGPSAGADASKAAVPPPPPDAATSPGACRTVTMNYFACASANETPGAPRLLAGRAYTLRFHGAYELDTTLQLNGATAACTSTMMGTLTLLAGEPSVERCLMPSEDIALLVTVASGDVQVWMQNGLRVEVCEGCQ